MKNIVWTGVIFLSIAVALGAAVETARSGDGDEVPADARREIKAANDGWLVALKRHDAAAVAEPYDADGVFVTPAGDVVKGPAGVRQLTEDRLKAAEMVGGTIQQDGIRKEGALVYEWGHATLEMRSGAGATTESKGRYLTVWRRDAQGRWRIWRNLSLAY